MALTLKEVIPPPMRTKETEVNKGFESITKAFRGIYSYLKGLNLEGNTLGVVSSPSESLVEVGAAGLLVNTGLLTSDVSSTITASHTRAHAIDSSSDHTSSITENNLMDADANGLPDDSGIAVGNVVQSSAVLVDNTIVRGDGGAKNVQDSGIVIDDSDNLSGVYGINIVCNNNEVVCNNNEVVFV